MIATKGEEYRNLALDSSNFMLESDGPRVLGRWEKAAYALWQAGHLRRRIGSLCAQEGDFARAAEAWLSSTACFRQAADLEQAKTSFELVQRLEQEDKIPPERGDLLTALQEREEEIHQLERALADFNMKCLATQFAGKAGKESLNSLVEQVKHFPGWALLHLQIHKLALDLGERELAAKHIPWAAAFGANLSKKEPEIRAMLLGEQLLASGDWEVAKKLATEFLAVVPDSAAIRILLARTLVSAGHWQRNLEEALKVLQPVAESSQEDARAKTAALALCAAFCFELGREAQSVNYLEEMERLASGVRDQELQSASELFHRLISVEANGTGSAGNGEPGQLTDANRQLLLDRTQQLLHPAA